MAKQPNEYHVVAFDPGGHIGYAHFILDIRAFSRPEHKVLSHIKHWECGEFSGDEYAQCTAASRLVWKACYGEMPFNTLTHVVSSGMSRADIVSEGFELTQLIGGKDLLSPVRINAVLDYECRRWGIKLNLQSRTMRTEITPALLQKMKFDSPMNRGGRWVTSGRGKDAFSAMQHGVVWLRRQKAASLSQPWKLSDGQTHNARWDCSCEKGKKSPCDISHPR